MYLGRLSPKKGIENLLRAMVQLRDSRVILKVYGAGEPEYTARLVTLAKSLQLSHQTVQFMGEVTGERKRAAFCSADVCIVPSFSENFCMVVAEALAHGVPVIASHGTPWPRLTENGCGLWVENSPEGLAKAISDVASMDLASMGARGYDWMKAEYSADIQAKRMLSVYSALAGGRGNSDGSVPVPAGF
jgi:glycosyltransferase involved in cell wall biosynthesis